MEEREWHFTDKEKWGPGQWQDEPDKIQFTDPTTGMACLIHRNNGGALCGYVGVPEGHPAYGKKYDVVDVNVHGGLTFADKCHEVNEATGRGICHVDPDTHTPLWWLGFDCAHYNDLCPKYAALHGEAFAYHGSKYRDINYVRKECADLAAQLKEQSK